MKNNGPSLRFHPFISRWMKKQNLKITYTRTELGWVADPKNERYPKDFHYDFKDISKDLGKINKIYGTCFDEEFLDIRNSRIGKLPKDLSLKQIIEKTKEVRKIFEIFPELEFEDAKSVYVGGICLPRRDFLYVEFHRLDSNFKENYQISDRRPRPIKSVSFIPIDKKYFKK